MSFLSELRRRHVIRAMLAYLAGAWLLIQVLETLFPIFGLPETSVRVIVVVLGIGTVPVAIAAWLLEWTPSGVVRDADAHPETVRAPASRNFDRVVIVVLAVAVVYFAVDRFLLGESADLSRAETIALEYGRRNPLDDASVAVLPFATDGEDERQQHFAAGLTDAIRISLAGVDGLRVTGRTSTEPYRETRLSTRKIGEILGVRALLSGNVRRSDDRIRIAAELLDAATESVIWAQTFDAVPAVENLLDIEDRIAEAVTRELQLELRTGAAEGPNEPQTLPALDAYHDGLYELHSMIQSHGDDQEQVLRAAAAFERAINADPGWAPPRAMLGRLYHFKWNATADPQDLASSRRHILDALRLDPAFEPALSGHAYLLWAEGEYQAALREYERAVDRGSADAWWGLGLLYGLLGRHDEAVRALRHAVTADPLVLAIRWQLAETYYCAGDYQAARDDFEDYFPLEADSPFADLIQRADLHAKTGNPDEALRIAERVVVETGSTAVVAAALLQAGQAARARAAVLQSSDDAPFMVLDIVPAVIMLGDVDRALNMLEEAAATAVSRFNRPSLIGWIRKLRCSPEIQTLEGQPRYQAILTGLGLPD